MSTDSPSSVTVVNAQQFIAHWQSHRRLTRRLIVAFPEDQLFTYSLGGMRSFGALALEIMTMATPTVRGIVTGAWEGDMGRDPIAKEELFRRWDETTAQLDELFPQIRPEQFAETMTAFGQYTMVVSDLLLYVVDNEIHHRGQGYVYLRALGVEPPPFYDRS